MRGAFRRDDHLNINNNATAGDAVAWVPHSRTLYAGDLLFIGGTPIVWAGPYKNWVTACERMVSHSLTLRPAQARAVSVSAGAHL